MTKKRFNPTAIARASKCLHSWYLECFGDPSEKREPDAGTLLLFDRGDQYEEHCVDSLSEVFFVDWDGKDFDEGYQNTCKAMSQGCQWIYQGILLTEFGLGIPDFLRKTDGRSALGNHTYIPVDVKNHKYVTKKDRYQLLAYASLLEPVLGYRPETGGIWLNTGEIELIDLTADRQDFEGLLLEMERIREEKLATVGSRCAECAVCAWVDHCYSAWEKNEDVCLIYGITGDLARRFRKAGFGSWRDIARADADEIAPELSISHEKARSVLLHAQARAKGWPEVIKCPTFPTDVPVHFYDIETYGESVYLHGSIRLFGGDREERQFCAEDPYQEKGAWHRYLDYLSTDDEAIIYCWTDYERGFVHALWEKYGGNPKGWSHLEENLVDQCKFVKDHFALPVYSYSIKSVAPVFGFEWSAEDAGGLNSEAWYKEWLETGDRKILAKILHYNLDDVLAMEIVDRKLRELISKERM